MRGLTDARRSGRARGDLEASIEASLEAHGASWGYHSRASTAHRYLCMTVPKVGCTTLKRTLHAFEGLSTASDWGEIHDQGAELRLSAFTVAEIADMLRSPDWLRFAFVRDPYHRMFSAWKSKIGNNWDTQYLPLRGQIRTAMGYPARTDRSAPMVAFRDFVRFIVDSDDPNVVRDGHWDLQVNVLLYDLIAYDVVGRFERFADDVTAILDRLGAPPAVLAIAREVTNPTPQVPLAAAYDRELADLVYRYYQPDFETFGYDRDGWLYDGT